MLRESAAVVSPIVGQAAIPGRLGVEELLILLPGTLLASGLLLAERILAAVAGHPFVLLPVGDGNSRRRSGHHQTISQGRGQMQ